MSNINITNMSAKNVDITGGDRITVVMRGDGGAILLKSLEDTRDRLPEGEEKGRIGVLVEAARRVGTEVLTGVITNVVRSMGVP